MVTGSPDKANGSRQDNSEISSRGIGKKKKKKKKGIGTGKKISKGGKVKDEGSSGTRDDNVKGRGATRACSLLVVVNHNQIVLTRDALHVRLLYY